MELPNHLAIAREFQACLTCGILLPNPIIGKNIHLLPLFRFWSRNLRTTQKDDITTQKANEELIYTTQKEDLTTQKSKTTTQKPVHKCPRLNILNVSIVQFLHLEGVKVQFMPPIWKRTASKDSPHISSFYSAVWKSKQSSALSGCKDTAFGGIYQEFLLNNVYFCSLIAINCK